MLFTYEVSTSWDTFAIFTERYIHIDQFIVTDQMFSCSLVKYKMPNSVYTAAQKFPFMQPMEIYQG